MMGPGTWDSSLEKNGTKDIVADSKILTTDSFWNSTDDDTVSLLQKEYKSVKEYSRAMRKKLSKVDQDKIAAASATELETVIQTYMEKAAEQQNVLKSSNGYSQKSQRGLHRFLDNFNGYVQAYSGVVSIMKGAGLGYGEAAYGALQLFLVISVNKMKTEEFIDRMLVELRQQYYRIQMLKDVYPTKRMKEYTAVLYRLGIQFLYETVRYYSMGAWRRAGYIFARPPSIGVERKVQEIKDAIRETEREMRALDGLRLNNMERVQEEIERQQQEDRRTLGEVSTILNALQIRTDNDRLDYLRKLLCLDNASIDFTIDQYEGGLKDTFYSLRRLPALDVENHVFCHPDFVSWRTSGGSALFLLHGATVAPEQTSYSWLSLAAVRIVSDFNLIFSERSNDDSPTLLSQYLHRIPDAISATQEKVSPVTMVATIIHQILKSSNGRRIIRDEEKFAFLKQSLEALEDGSSKQITEQCRRLNKILATLLEGLTVQCLVLVIDRIDRIQGGMEKAVDILTSLVENTKVTVKVFMTARSRFAFNDAEVKERLDGSYLRLTMNQDD